MAILSVYKRDLQFIDLANLVEELSSVGLIDVLEKYYDKPLEREVNSIVAGPSFLQFLNKLFQIQITTGDILHLESGDHSKYYMLSATGTWDEIIKLQWCSYTRKIYFSDIFHVRSNRHLLCVSKALLIKESSFHIKARRTSTMPMLYNFILIQALSRLNLSEIMAILYLYYMGSGQSK